MQKIVYFHGYGSSPNSDKVTALRNAGFDVFAPTIPELPSEVSSSVCDQLENSDYLSDAIFVGTSLGGYYANSFANLYLMPRILINPSCNPQETLKAYNNPKLTKDELSWLFPIEISSANFLPTTVILAKDDDILDYKIAMKKFEKFAKIVVKNNGGHRFNDINTISDNITEMANHYYCL